MRPPAWMTLRPRPVAAANVAAGTVTVTIDVDTTAMVEGLRAMGKAAEGAVASMNALMRSNLRACGRQLQAQRDARHAGQAMRWYVRGAMDPAYADPAARDACVRRIMAGRDHPPAHFADLAASFLRGWVEHRDGTECACTMTDPKWWTMYGGATEPGSQWEWNPDCPVHPPRSWQHPHPMAFYRVRYVAGMSVPGQPLPALWSDLDDNL